LLECEELDGLGAGRAGRDPNCFADIVHQIHEKRVRR
jgi:hypothetical protein